MTKLDEILNELRIINESLFKSNDSLMVRMKVLEKSVNGCQLISEKRRDQYAKAKIAIITSFIASIFALIISWIKK